MNDTINLLLNHVSIRRYKNEQIDDKIVDTIIKCAQMAPTSSHFQAYTIINVKDEGKKDLLYKISGNQRWVKEAPLVLLFCADLNRGKKYFNVADKNVFSNTENYTIGVVDASLAMQKAFIAAQSMGLGGVVVGGIRNDVEALSIEFKLPDMVAPLFLLCLGFPDESPGIKPRLPKEEICKVNFYDDYDQENLISEYNEGVKEYYNIRSKGKIQDTWTDRCGRLIIEKTRDDVGYFFRKIGLLKK